MEESCQSIFTFTPVITCCDYAKLQSVSFKYLRLIYLHVELLDIENSLSFTVMNFKYFVK